MLTIAITAAHKTGMTTPENFQWKNSRRNATHRLILYRRRSAMAAMFSRLANLRQGNSLP
jgi:hypothetical protein